MTSMVEEYAIKLTITLIPSSSNKADSMTRVPQCWLQVHGHHPPPVLPMLDPASQPMCAAAAAGMEGSEIADIHHATGHPGVKRTL